MANICDVIYQCEGSKESIDEIYNILTDIDRSLEDSKWWLGNFIKRLGLDPSKYTCRGDIEFYTRISGCAVRIYQSTAWCEQEGVRHAIEEVFPDVKVYFQEEEPGDEVYYTNSFDIFPERYLIADPDDYHYFDNLTQVSRYLKGKFEKEINDELPDIEEAIEEYNSKQEDWDEHIYLHIFKLRE